jgi:hypothetical protein
MLKYLIAEEIVDEGTPLDAAQKFVEAAVKAEECYDAYAALRRAVTGKKKK